MKRDKFCKIKKKYNKRKRTFFKQKFIWFSEAFLISWIAIFFISGFLWVSIGSGHSAMSLEESTLNVLHSYDNKISKDTMINFMGINISIPINEYKEKLKIISEYRVLIPPIYRLFLNLVGISVHAIYG